MELIVQLLVRPLRRLLVSKYTELLVGDDHYFVSVREVHMQLVDGPHLPVLGDWRFLLPFLYYVLHLVVLNDVKPVMQSAQFFIDLVSQDFDAALELGDLVLSLLCRLELLQRGELAP